MRHAKSDWSTGEADFKRPLNKRGENASAFMGKLMKKRDLVPDFILSSPAKRAKQTAKRVAKNSAYTGEIKYVEDFYFGDNNDVLKEIRKSDNEIKRLMIIGHNPTWEYFCLNMIKTKDIEIRMPTASIVSLSVDLATWKQLEFDSCQLEQIIKPKDFQENIT